ncbi:MAG: FAD-dependent oxidoreductase [Thermoleophilaceae bacterium]
MAWNFVIAGGGFGGLYAARKLERALPRHSARITLVTTENFLLYSPLLPGAASGTLEPRHVVVPLGEELDWADLRLGKVTGADPARRELHFTTPDGRDHAEPYDHLIVALGSESRVLPVPGLAEHGVGFKTLPDAVGLRNRVISNLEIAESVEDPDVRREYLTFVFIGAGYAGLEGIAELQDFASDVIDRYPRCRLDGMRWILVEAQERVMPEVPPSLARFAEDELRARGIIIRVSGVRVPPPALGNWLVMGDLWVQVRWARTGICPGCVPKQISVSPLDGPSASSRYVLNAGLASARLRTPCSSSPGGTPEDCSAWPQMPGRDGVHWMRLRSVMCLSSRKSVEPIPIPMPEVARPSVTAETLRQSTLPPHPTSATRTSPPSLGARTALPLARSAASWARPPRRSCWSRLQR